MPTPSKKKTTTTRQSPPRKWARRVQLAVKTSLIQSPPTVFSNKTNASPQPTESWTIDDALSNLYNVTQPPCFETSYRLETDDSSSGVNHETIQQQQDETQEWLKQLRADPLAALEAQLLKEESEKKTQTMPMESDDEFGDFQCAHQEEKKDIEQDEQERDEDDVLSSKFSMSSNEFIDDMGEQMESTPELIVRADAYLERHQPAQPDDHSPSSCSPRNDTADETTQEPLTPPFLPNTKSDDEDDSTTSLHSPPDLPHWTSLDSLEATSVVCSPSENAIQPSSAAVRRCSEQQLPASTIPLSLRLPLTHLDTLEARFTRRRQLHSSTASAAAVGPLETNGTSLPNYYYTTTTDLDDTVKVLEALPWHNDNWEATILDRLCDLDAALETTNEQMLSTIVPHQPQLDIANQALHEYQTNLTLAVLYWKRTQNSVQAAVGDPLEGTGIAGWNGLLESWAIQEDYSALEHVLTDLNAVLHTEQELLQKLQDLDSSMEDYPEIVRLADTLNNNIEQSSLKELTCLDDLHHRVTNVDDLIGERLLELGRNAVVSSCRRTFDESEYERLIDELSPDRRKAWVDCVVEALLYEAERTFCVALLLDNAQVSEFHRELRQLSNEMDATWGDGTKLRTLAHNLVVIRFNFEWQMSHLPQVYLGLCENLSRILYAHYQLVQFHKKRSDEYMKSLLLESTERLVNHCEHVLMRCLDEYLHFSGRRPLFERSKDHLDDSLWKTDLENLRTIFVLSECFLAVKHSFLVGLEVVPTAKDSSRLDDSPLSEKLSDIFRRHLRTVHIEAMNTLGRCLSKEVWTLGPFESDEKSSVEDIVGDALSATRLSVNKMSVPIPNCDPFARWPEAGNPFGSIPAKTVFCPSATVNSRCAGRDDFPTAANGPVEAALNKLVHDSRGDRIAPQAVTKNLVGWFGRLLTIFESLPLIVDDVSAVFANLCDLYITTVFRLCAGNARNERLLMGKDTPSPLFVLNDDQPPVPISTENLSASQIFRGFGKGKRPSFRAKPTPRFRTVLSDHLDAEIWSPLSRDNENTEKLRKFLVRAQESLEDVVNLNMVDSWMKSPGGDTQEERMCEIAKLLVQRESAVWSCLSVAVMMKLSFQEMTSSLSRLLPAEETDEKLAPLCRYCGAFYDITLTLTETARRIACIRALSGSSLVEEITKVRVWEENTLHEFSNDYVDDLCDCCALLWGFVAASAKLPDPALQSLWECVVSTVYRCLLDGFARIPSCSTEGRALMTLDLATFSAGVSKDGLLERLEDVLLVDPPPRIQPEFSRPYVETFVKVFYYPKDDVMSWIASNYQDYHVNHMLSLVQAIQTSEDDHVGLISSVKALYGMAKGDEPEIVAV